MNIPTELLPVVQITLPLIVTIGVVSWSQNKRIDDIVQRLTAIEARLTSIEGVLRDFAQRITRLEERTPGPKLVSK